jgi:hypothetical protein
MSIEDEFDNLKDKLYDVTNQVGDWVPREFAEYAPFILPFIAPYAGEGITQALGQAASWKMNDGRFDPFTAMAIHGGANTKEAQARRARGDTWGQKGGSWISDRLYDPTKTTTGWQNTLARGFDPNEAMFQQTHYVPTHFENKFEGSGAAKNVHVDTKHPLEVWQEGDRKYIKSYKENPYDAFLDQGMTTAELGNKELFMENYLLGEPETRPDLIKDENGKWKAATEGQQVYRDSEGDWLDASHLDQEEIAKLDVRSATRGNMTEKDIARYEYNANTWNKEAADDVIRQSGFARTPTGEKSLLAQARDSAVASYMPGFKDAKGNFSLTNTVSTLSTVLSLGSMKKIARELAEDRKLEEAEKGKIWVEYFKQWEEITGEDYMETPELYRDSFLENMHRQYAAEGGRIGYNLGGGISELIPTPQGVPQGMQIDGRPGMFVEQGIEEKADDVPAMLSKNEFVLTADAMRGLDKMMGGSGDPRAAAKTMYQTMSQLEAMA